MEKLISRIALVLLLLVVPFVSWFYLRKGLEYRKALVREVVVKDSVRISEDTLKLLKGKTSVISMAGGIEANSIISGLYEQFKEVPRFQILSSGGRVEDKEIPSGYFEALAARYRDNKFILVDTAGMIRNVYMDGKEDIKKLVEHIAVVLPRKEEADIKSKR